MKNFFFLLGLSFICTHELDAVAQHEWRLLYILRSLPEPTAALAFVALHVPAFTLLVWLTHHSLPRVRETSRLALMVFLVIHVGLHVRLSTHPLYSFHSPLSMGLIFGAGLCGLAYLLAIFANRSR